jgi:hypothetical protein
VPQLPYNNNNNNNSSSTRHQLDPYSSGPVPSSAASNSALPKRSSFTQSQPDERAAVSTATATATATATHNLPQQHGHFSAAPRRKAKVTNPDNGITVLHNDDNSNGKSNGNERAFRNVSIATRGGAPAKQPNFRSATHLQRGENPIVQVQVKPNDDNVHRFGSYLDTNEYSDVTFQYKAHPQVSTQAHKIVVASHSSVLKQAIDHSTDATLVVLDAKNGDPRALTACLQWMYRREEPSTSSGAVHLANVMGCALSLKIDELPQVIFAELLPIVALSNVVAVAEVADFYHLENLLSSCVDVCSKKMSDVAFEDTIRSMCAESEASLAEMVLDGNDNALPSTPLIMPVRDLVIRLLCARTVAPMAMAVRFNLLSIVKTLLNDSDKFDKSALLSKCDETGARPLELALRLGHDTLVEPLVSAGDEMVANQRMTPSRGLANRPGGTRADHFKLEAGEQTMLHLAAASGNVRNCRVLIDAGANVNAVNSSGRSPLHLATLSGDLESLRLLLDRGVAPNLQDANGHTALHLVTGGDLPEDVLDVDLATFDDLKLANSNTNNGLGGSSGGHNEHGTGGKQQNVRTLSQQSSRRQMETPSKRRAGASGEVTFNFAPLPLSQAERVVDMLLQTKINVHIPDGKGRTPLHVAVWRGALNITRRLLEAGADPVSYFFISLFVVYFVLVIFSLFICFYKISF